MNNELAVIESEHLPAVRESLPVGALSASQVVERLDFIKQVMANAMVVGQDYGKVPGCGDKPGLFQPGAQKLSMTFQLNPEVQEEVITDYQNYHRGYRLVVRVSNGSKFADGVGECSTLESKYRFRSAGRKCPQCGKETIIKGRAEYGGGWLCFGKKGGCGAKFADGDMTIEGQAEGKVENENPADAWNTARKMAFKRAFVHAIINATNTSELWSQDLEDLADNSHNAAPEPPKMPSAPKSAPKANIATNKANVEPLEQKRRTRFMSLVEPYRGEFVDLAIQAGWLQPDQRLEDLDNKYVPTDKATMDKILADCKALKEKDVPTP